MFSQSAQNRRQMLATIGLAPLCPIIGRAQVDNAAALLEVEPTVFVLRGRQCPLRRIDVRVLDGGKPQAVAGRLDVRFGGSHSSLNLQPAQFVGGAYGWMWPFRRGIERWYDAIVAGL